MKKLATFTSVAALVAAFGFAGVAIATHVGAPSRYADSVVDQGTVGSILVSPHSSSDNVLGAEDGTGGTGWFNLGSGFGDDGDDPEGFIIVSFDDNAVIPDGTAAPDLTVWEASSNGNNNDLADVFVSADGINWFLVGEARDYPAPVPGGNPPFANDFDIDGTGLTFVKFVKLVNKMAPNNDGASGFDSDAFEGLTSIGTDDIVKVNTGLLGIDVGSGVLQTGFKFEITITNNTGVAGGLSDLTFFDAVPAEFDLSGAPTVVGNCTIETDNPEGAKKKGLSKLEPEFIIIDAGGLGIDETCTVEVSVQTDTKDFPKGKSPAFTPTSCLADPGTIVLNDGVKVFDSVMNLVLQDDDSLTLDCNNTTG